MDETSSARHSSTSKKFKAACDQCHSSKVKCPGGDPPCKRCADARLHCHYSLSARIGKPPGSKNKKTLERLNSATSQRSRDDTAVTISQNASNICPAKESDGPDKEWVSESQQRNGYQPQSSSLTLAMPFSPSLSPSSHCFDFLESVQSSDPLMQEFQGMDPTVQVENNGENASTSTMLTMSDVESPGEAESRMSWTDIMDNYPKVRFSPCFAATILKMISCIQRLCNGRSLSQLEPVSPVMVDVKEDTIKLMASSCLQVHAPILPSRMQLSP